MQGCDVERGQRRDQASVSSQEQIHVSRVGDAHLNAHLKKSNSKKCWVHGRDKMGEKKVLSEIIRIFKNKAHLV